MLVTYIPVSAASTWVITLSLARIKVIYGWRPHFIESFWTTSITAGDIRSFRFATDPWIIFTYGSLVVSVMLGVA